MTRVAASHTERVGGIEGVARAKRELVEQLPPDGVAVLNADDHRVAAMALAAAGEVVTFGVDSGDVRVRDLELDALARPRFTIETPWGSGRVELAASGVHMASNAAAAPRSPASSRVRSMRRSRRSPPRQCRACGWRSTPWHRVPSS
ncbi:MAG: Mur ligase family protein [Ilumatobacteraceae bacterium]